MKKVIGFLVSCAFVFAASAASKKAAENSESRTPAQQNCYDDEALRTQILTEIRQNFGGKIVASSVYHALEPQQVVTAGANPLAANFKATIPGADGKPDTAWWIAQFGFDYSTCIATYKGATRAAK